MASAPSDTASVQAQSSTALAGRRLDAAAWAVLAAMPLALSFAVRSSAALIVAAGALALAGALASGRGGATAHAAARHAVSMPGVLAPLFAVLAGASLLWHPFPTQGLFAFGEAFAPLAGALALGLCLGLPDTQAERQRLFFVAASLFGLACIEVSLELWTNMAWREALGARTALFVLNKPVICLVVLYWPLLALSEGMPRRTLVMGVLAVLMAAATFKSVSGASMLALVCGLLTYVLARFAPRLMWGVMMLGLAVALSLAPVKGELAHRTIPDAALDRIQSLHARDRVEIWQSFGEVVSFHPLAGVGFGSSPRMGDAPVAARVPPEHRTLLAVGHAHDMFLQIWSELGALGALLAALGLFWLGRATRLLPAQRMAPALACLAAILVIAEVGHGAWQGWWVAIVGAACVWFAKIYGEAPAQHGARSAVEGHAS